MVLNHVLKNLYPQIWRGRLHGRCSQLWTGETTLPVSTNIHNSLGTPLQITSNFSLLYLRFTPNHFRNYPHFHWFGVISLFPIILHGYTKENKVQSSISRCSVDQRIILIETIPIIILKPIYPNVIGIILDSKNLQYLQSYLRHFLARFHTETKSVRVIMLLLIEISQNSWATLFINIYCAAPIWMWLDVK